MAAAHYDDESVHDFGLVQPKDWQVEFLNSQTEELLNNDVWTGVSHRRFTVLYASLAVLSVLLLARCTTFVCYSEIFCYISLMRAKRIESSVAAEVQFTIDTIKFSHEFARGVCLGDPKMTKLSSSQQVKLAHLLNLQPADLHQRLSTDRRYVALKHDVRSKHQSKSKQLSKGWNDPTYKRFYPGLEAFAPIVGRVDHEGLARKGWSLGLIRKFWVRLVSVLLKKT